MKWVFIYTLDSPDDERRRDIIGSLTCIGVPRVADAPAIARECVEQGAELIELCGGFGGSGLGEVVAAVAGRVPVGAVFYGVDASAGLQRLFGRDERAIPESPPADTT